ncbi:MAG: hypothetical protein ABW321_31870 [Polyangiales bacterium]
MQSELASDESKVVAEHDLKRNRAFLVMHLNASSPRPHFEGMQHRRLVVTERIKVVDLVAKLEQLAKAMELIGRISVAP